MMISRIKLIFGILVAAVAAALIFLQYQTQQKLRAENASLQQQIAQLKSESPEPPAANSNSVPNDDFNELLRLRGEVSALRAQTNQIARLQQQNQQLKDSQANTLSAGQQAVVQSALQAQEERAYLILQVNTSRQAVLAMNMYATDHQDQLPTNLNQTTAYFGNSDVATNIDQFEIVYHGALSNLANPASAIVVRSLQPWASNGRWSKAYGFADGHAQVYSTVDKNFDEWEQIHAPMLKNP